MRKKIYHFYNLISSYPVLIFMIIVLGIIFYLGTEYKPLELETLHKQEVQMGIKQEQKTIQNRLSEIGIGDTIKRYTLFNRDLLERSNADEGELSNLMNPTFRSYGWNLNQIDCLFLEDKKSHTPAQGAKIDGLIIKIEASAIVNVYPNGDPFLPFYSFFEMFKYMWSRPPFKEYQRIKLYRTEDGYNLDSSIFMPLQDVESSSRLNEDAVI